MASIIKERARKPLMEGAVPLGTQTWEDGQHFFRLDLLRSEGADHAVLLTRVEMLQVVSEWLKIESRRENSAFRR